MLFSLTGDTHGPIVNKLESSVFEPWPGHFVVLERFSIECHKNKTKVITTPIRWKEDTFKGQWKLKNRPNILKRGKTRASKSCLVLVLHLICWESGVSFLDQSQSEVKQNQCNPGKLLTRLRESWRIGETSSHPAEVKILLIDLFSRNWDKLRHKWVYAHVRYNLFFSRIDFNDSRKAFQAWTSQGTLDVRISTFTSKIWKRSQGLSRLCIYIN